MKKLVYTLLGEGIAEYEFIPAYLNIMAAKQDIQLVRSRLEIKPSSSPSSSKVLASIGEFCAQSLVVESEDIFIAGIDLDEPDHSDEQKLFSKQIEKLKTQLGKLHSSYKEKIILFVPIQCIDHWIAYLHYKISIGKKYSANSMEKVKGDDIKEQVYNKKKPDRHTITHTISKILINCDFDTFEELARQSKSFNHFHTQVKVLLGIKSDKKQKKTAR